MRISTNYAANRPISEYAALCGMSEVNFRRLFHKHTGKSPSSTETISGWKMPKLCCKAVSTMFPKRQRPAASATCPSSFVFIRKNTATHPKRNKNSPAMECSRAVPIQLATETAANPAENLPDGAAFCVAIGIAREEEHLADLLFRICLARTRGL